MNNNNYKRVLEVITYDSKESNIDIMILLNDLPYNMELSGSLDIPLQELNTITNDIEKGLVYNTLENGDTLNYDIILRNGDLKNFSDIVLDKNSYCLKLNRLDIKWYCTKFMFKQLLNITIIK